METAVCMCAYKLDVIVSSEGSVVVVMTGLKAKSMQNQVGLHALSVIGMFHYSCSVAKKFLYFMGRI